MIVLNECGSFMRDGLFGSMRSGKRCWCVVARRECGLPMRDAFRGSTWNRETAQARGRAERVRFARARWPPRFHAKQEEALVCGRVERMRLAHARCPSPFTWWGSASARSGLLSAQFICLAVPRGTASRRGFIDRGTSLG